MSSAYKLIPEPGPEAEIHPTASGVCLASLEPGAECVVHWVDDSTAEGRRLLDLGFVPESPLRVLRRAPLGDPVAYELRGSRICLRRSEARRIRVRPRIGPA